MRNYFVIIKTTTEDKWARIKAEDTLAATHTARIMASQQQLIVKDIIVEIYDPDKHPPEGNIITMIKEDLL